MRDTFRARETELDTATGDQQATEREKVGRLSLAEAADAEVRHPHPRQVWPSLPAAEPQPAPKRGHDHDGEREIPIGSGRSRGHDHGSQPPPPLPAWRRPSASLRKPSSGTAISPPGSPTPTG